MSESKRETTDFSSPFLEEDRTKRASLSLEEARKDPRGLKTIVDEFGFVIVPGILSEEECEAQREAWFHDLMDLVDKDRLEEEIKASDPEGYVHLGKAYKRFASRTLPWPKASTPGITSKGFFTSSGVPQAPSTWTARTNPKVRECFSLLHETRQEELVVGTDVVFYSTTTEARTSNPFWGHADQRDDTTSYQGILYVEDGSLPSSAQTIVWPGSNRPEIYNRFRGAGGALAKHAKDHSLYIDRIVDPDLKKEFYEGWCTHARRLPIPPGGLLIFASKTIHQGYNGQGSRHAYPISWAPSYRRTGEALLSKLQAVVLGIATTHWAEYGIHHGASKVGIKKPLGSKKPHQCIFPLTPLRPYPLKPGISPPPPSSIKSLSLYELQDMICPEILALL